MQDQYNNSNKIYANRYQGAFGIWYFVIDSTLHFENVLAILLFTLIVSAPQYIQITIGFPVVALSVNVTLMCLRNLTLELR